MNVFLIVFSYILIPILAFLVGYGISRIRRRTKSYSGTMKVIRDEDKIIYTLELDDDPIAFANMSEVVFRIDTSAKSSIAKETISIMNSTEGG